MSSIAWGMRMVFAYQNGTSEVKACFGWKRGGRLFCMWQGLTGPRHACHVMCSLVPKWCTWEALIATEWVVFWTWSLGPFWCTSMPNVWPVPKNWKVGCAMFSPFRLHVLGIPQTWKCRVLLFVQVQSFWGHFWNTKYRKKRCRNIHGKLKRSCVSPFATCHLRVLLHSAVVAPVINSWSKQWETHKSQLLDFCRYLYLGKSCNLIAIFNWAVAKTLTICSVYRIRLPM